MNALYALFSHLHQVIVLNSRNYILHLGLKIRAIYNFSVKYF